MSHYKTTTEYESEELTDIQKELLKVLNEYNESPFFYTDILCNSVLENSEIPNKLFKYRKIDEEFFDYILDSIKQEYFYFSDPKTFDDVYDCNIKFNDEREWVTSFINRYNEIFSGLKVLCLSKTNNCSKMRKQYCNNNGIIIEYDFSTYIDTDFTAIKMKDIIYTNSLKNEMNIYDDFRESMYNKSVDELLVENKDYLYALKESAKRILREMHRRFFNYIFLKNVDYSFENEIRVLFYKDKLNYSPFNISIKVIYYDLSVIKHDNFSKLKKVCKRKNISLIQLPK